MDGFFLLRTKKYLYILVRALERARCVGEDGDLLLWEVDCSSRVVHALYGYPYKASLWGSLQDTPPNSIEFSALLCSSAHGIPVPEIPRIPSSSKRSCKEPQREASLSKYAVQYVDLPATQVSIL